MADKKAAWEMTPKQYESDMREYWERTRGSGLRGTKAPELPADMSLRFAEVHKQLVDKALTEGKPVPDSVLKSYPDLVRLAAKAVLSGKNKRIYFSGPVAEALSGKSGIELAEEVQKEKVTKPVNLEWDSLHKQSREELLVGAEMQTKLADKKWSDLAPWIQGLLKESLEGRSKGKAKLGADEAITIDPGDPDIEVWKPKSKPRKPGKLVLLVKKRDKPETTLGGMGR